MQNGEFDLFLGAGASVNSGISTGGDLVWFFKREIYCNENHISPEKYKDLKLPSTQELLQNYFDKKEGYPARYAPNEYSFYFEKCYNSPIARKRFIESKVARHDPSLGYLCLAELLLQKKIQRVWTTNFDSLTETAVGILNPQEPFLVCSSSNAESIRNFNPTYSYVCKLHGDFRYDNLQNTDEELRTLENSLQEHWKHCLINRGLIVIGYSGNDESIMSFIERNITDSNFLSNGLYWTTLQGHPVSKRVDHLISTAKTNGKIAEIVEINNFDSFMFSLYKSLGFSNKFIEEKRSYIDNNYPLHFEGCRINDFVKLNSFKALSIPQWNSFKTDITSWAELRKIVNPHDFIVSLYSGHIYSFESQDKLKDVFGTHVKSEVVQEVPAECIIQKSDSIYIGMLYDLVKLDMCNRGFMQCKRNKYYDINTKQTNKAGNYVFDAIEVSIEFYKNELYLFLIPSVHVKSRGKNQLPIEDYNIQCNQVLSSLYNKQYNEKLYKWQKLLYQKDNLTFQYGSFKLSFCTIPLSSGGNNRKNEWPELQAFCYDEPIMCFSDTDLTCTSTNQLIGLSQYGPLDCSYVDNASLLKPIQIAIFSPKERLSEIIGHLSSLKHSSTPRSKDMFLQDYAGFSNVYRRNLLIPEHSDSNLCITYPIHAAMRLTEKEFLDFIKRGIDRAFKNSLAFDVLVIYIPKCFERFRESCAISADYNLHDAVKLYGAEKGVSIQFIEEKSLHTYDPCKVMWGLSTSIYAKSQGVLWHPQAIRDDTAYIGIGYSKSENQGICIGCSQLFDSTGTGIRMILKKIKNPCYYAKSNPYMDRDESREMMLELREKYYHCCPTAKLNRIVVHKTTPFMKEEIIGITQAFEGVDVELLQIQEYSPWRGIRFGKKAQHEAHNFALSRGTVIPIQEDSFLMWTHGSLHIPSWTGNSNYYKGSRGIPAPLLVKRFLGQSDGDLLANEILMLTKMNWNSGDSLYKTLPVTLDFAKVLSRMSKQNEALFDKSYDFRYFM